MLPPEMISTLEEAFEKRVVETRKQVEMSVREEMAARYENDKANLVEAMDRMLSDVVQKHIAEKNEAVAKFKEARMTFRKAVKENRKKYNTKLDESVQQSRTVMMEALRKEIGKLREQKKILVAEKLASADKLTAMKESMAKLYSKRIRKIDEFVVRQVRKELGSFNDDHRALVETRVKLVTEGRKKLRETQARFVKQAARNVEKVVNESLKREMTQLHEDLERNRQNMFGRRIFEAVAAEYLTSYLAEGTEIRNLQNKLEETKKEAEGAKAKLTEAVKEGQIATRKARLAEDRAVRGKMMGELLTNLRGEKRTVMEGMLETVKTEALRETFNKLLPVVLDEGRKTNVRDNGGQKKPLMEVGNQQPRRPVASVVTGNNRSATRLFETAQAETNTDFNDDIAQVVRLAGIQK
ncbi:unnamed protein product [Sphagnum tenellum]